MSYEPELQAALAAADKASQIILDCYTRFRTIPDAPASIHTEADSLSQQAILDHLRRAFPKDSYCAEEVTAEGEAVLGTGSRLWIIDPIDGTRGFAKKNDEFSVMIAFVEGGMPAVGVVLEPARQRLTYAVKGGGCWKRDGNAPATRCRVSDTTELANATLVQSRSRDPGVPTGHVVALQPARIVEAYSAGLKLAMAARGEADLYVNRYAEFHDWDICAGHILVEEAGGTATGLKGERLQYGLPGAWQRHGLLASNGRLHESALEKLATASGE